jgi:murein DD-endopeptidase MepM/ murein hydrolase activator NlpD
MSIGPAIYLGQVGSTGRSTGPHAHKEVLDLRTGKRIPLSQARTDIGQKIQFRLPGSQEWQQLYTQTAPGQFALNPRSPMTSPKGMRTHPVTGQQAYHQGEDYGLPLGTDLRFLGTGAVEGIANYGHAGNIARLKTGDNRYQLDVFHLDKLPGTTQVGDSAVPEAPQLPTSQSNEDNNNRLMESLFGKKESLKDVLIAGALQNALMRRNSALGSLPPMEASAISPMQAMEMFS